MGGAHVLLRAPKGASVVSLVDAFLLGLEAQWGYPPELRGYAASLREGMLEIVVWVHT